MLLPVLVATCATLLVAHTPIAEGAPVPFIFRQSSATLPTASSRLETRGLPGDDPFASLRQVLNTFESTPPALDALPPASLQSLEGQKGVGRGKSNADTDALKRTSSRLSEVQSSQAQNAAHAKFAKLQQADTSDQAKQAIVSEPWENAGTLVQPESAKLSAAAANQPGRSSTNTPSHRKRVYRLDWHESLSATEQDLEDLKSPDPRVKQNAQARVRRSELRTLREKLLSISSQDLTEDSTMHTPAKKDLDDLESSDPRVRRNARDRIRRSKDEMVHEMVLRASLEDPTQDSTKHTFAKNLDDLESSSARVKKDARDRIRSEQKKAREKILRASLEDPTQGSTTHTIAKKDLDDLESSDPRVRSNARERMQYREGKRRLEEAVRAPPEDGMRQSANYPQSAREPQLHSSREGQDQHLAAGLLSSPASQHPSPPPSSPLGSPPRSPTTSNNSAVLFAKYLGKYLAELEDTAASSSSHGRQ